MRGLAPVPAGSRDDLLIGLAEGDDAAVLRLDSERALIVTADFFTPIVDSPYDWGRVAAANALSDVYAMGGRPVLALNLSAWPATRLPLVMLGEVLRGGADVAAAAGCAIVGGHTVDDAVPKYGMAVVGLAHPERLFTLDGARPGDRLVVTKRIGTGVVATALKRDVPGAAAAVPAAIESMTTLNAAACAAARDAGVRAATDVTGYGLLGHLHRLLRASGHAATVDAASVPLLPGALTLAAAGCVPGGTRANVDYVSDAVDVAADVPAALAVLLHDAQTSGGLLLAVPPAAVDRLLRELRGQGLPAASIGRVVVGRPGAITVLGSRPG